MTKPNPAKITAPIIIIGIQRRISKAEKVPWVRATIGQNTIKSKCL